VSPRDAASHKRKPERKQALRRADSARPRRAALPQGEVADPRLRPARGLPTPCWSAGW